MASLKKRGECYYLQFYVAGKKQRRLNLDTDSYQIAKEKLRQFESAQARGDELPLATRTPPAKILAAYVEHIRTVKPPKSAQNDIYYLRDLFGPCCEALAITSRKISRRVKKRPPKPGQDRRFKAAVLEPQFIEQLTTADISTFITSRMGSRGLAPKTANHYRSILGRLFTWAADQRGVRLPGSVNPALKVEKLREPAPEITFLTLEQIEQQVDVLKDAPRFQAAVATYIFAGLRREELLWLTHDDIDWNAKPYGIIRVRAKTVGEESWQPKTRSNRAVPISSQLRTYLDKQWLRASKSIWLFPNSSDGRYDPDNFSTDLREANKKAGIAWSCLHYRHTFGSQLAMKGESLFKIARLMGNSPQIAERHYAALLPESLVTSVEFGTPPANGRAETASVISA